MNKKQSQAGSAHLIIIIILCLALVGSLGFVFYQNFVQNKDDISKTNVEKTNDETKTEDTSLTPEQKTPTVDPTTVVNDFLTSFMDYIGTSTAGHTDASFAAQSSALTDEFKDEITQPNQGLMYSPIILAQNLPPSFTVGGETINGENATVPVTLKFSPESNIIYSLTIVNNEWKIDGVVKE